MNGVNTPLVHTVRRFNRFYTNVLGLLDRHMLDSDYSLSEARVLYEIGHLEKCTAKRLSEELKIDPGYLSRIIKRFEKAGLIYREQSAEDGRLYYLYPTEYGKETLAQLDDRSNQEIYGMIGELKEEKQAQLVQSMQGIERALSRDAWLGESKITLRCKLKPGDVGRLIHLHGRLYADECGYNHAFEGYVCQTFADFFANYSANKDRFWFAELNGEIIGAIAIVGHSADQAQLRWFILQPEYRGMGLGQKMLQEALQYAREKGFRKLFLETTADQEKAIRMYRKAGFRKVSAHENQAWGKDLIEQTFELSWED